MLAFIPLCGSLLCRSWRSKLVVNDRQQVHHHSTLHGNGQWSATIARITTKTQTTILTTKRSSESYAIQSSCGWPYPQARLGAERNLYSMSSETKSGSSSVKIKQGVSTNVLSKSNRTHRGGINKIYAHDKSRIMLEFNLRKTNFNTCKGLFWNRLFLKQFFSNRWGWSTQDPRF